MSKTDEIKKYIESNSGCKLLTTQYKSSEKLKLKCICGNEFETELSNFKRGKRKCEQCSSNKIYYNRNNMLNHLDNVIKENNYTMVSKKEYAIKGYDEIIPYRKYSEEFGTYRDAVRLLGYYIYLDKIYTKELALEILNNLINSGLTSVKQLQKHESMIDYRIYFSIFNVNTWDEVLREIGIEVSTVRWTQELVDYLIKNDGVKTDIEMSNELNIPIGAIRCKRQRLGIKAKVEVKWTKELIINNVQEFYIKNKRIPKSDEFTNGNNLPSAKYAFELFSIKGIDELYFICGFTEEDVSKKMSDEEGLKRLNDFYNLLGRIPTNNDFRDHNFRPHCGWYIDRFGSKNNALLKLGLIENIYTTEERINFSILELKELATQLNRYPYTKEYEAFRKNGYSVTPLQNNLKTTFSQFCIDNLPEFAVPEGFHRCPSCGEIKPLVEFGSAGEGSCNLCNYIKRNKEFLNGLPSDLGWSNDEYIFTIDNLLCKKVSSINELSEILNKSLDDVIYTLQNTLKLSNITYTLKLTCSNCGKEFSTNQLSRFYQENVYCCHECYYEHKKITAPKGEDSPNYNRITMKCDYCEEDIKVIPFNVNLNTHNFCSQECNWAFRKEYYVGDKSNFYGRTITDEQREEMRIRTVKMYEDGIFGNNVETKPQLIVNNILDVLNINYVREKGFKYYSVDNYLIEQNLIIEVMGDYFHCSPRRYEFIENQIQYKGIIRDKSKQTYIKKYYDIDILYLWEHNINNNPELCLELIKYYISNNGNIEDYNSFNYELIDTDLNLKKEKMMPFTSFSAIELENKIIDETVKQLKRTKRITFNCECCGKETTQTLAYYNLRQKHTCSSECMEEIRYPKKISYNCDFCGEELELRQCEFENSKHHFCSRECNWEFQKGKYFGKKKEIIPENYCTQLEEVI